ncbi:MAG: hypothetical protein KGI54_18530 [Pseudomonadota bacterium]|nr:hypothetical protein [Pseudomonadota bacterium]
MNKMILTVVIIATELLSGCAHMISRQAYQHIDGITGYAMVAKIYPNLNDIPFSIWYDYKCNATNSKEVCSHLSEYNFIGAYAARGLTGEDVFVSMLAPKNNPIHIGDIIKFKNARVERRFILNAQFAGITRTADKEDKTCYFKNHVVGGEVVCNGWSAASINKYW